MKDFRICVCAGSPFADPWMVSTWLKYYETHTGIQHFNPTLLYTKDVTPSILRMWPHEKIMIEEDWDFLNDIAKYDLTQKLWFRWRINTWKMLAYKTAGPCMFMDYDSILQRVLLEEMIPDCKFGLVKQEIEYQDRFDRIPTWDIFNEVSLLDMVYSGLIIFREDYYDLYKEKFYQYINKCFIPYSYCEAVIALVHKISQGTFLQPEWCWVQNAFTQNNKDIIFKHYSGNTKETLLLQEELMEHIK